VAVDRLSGGPAFGAEDASLLEAFAASTATAVATAESVASEQQRQRLAAAESERGRWARELHDETLQAFAALRLQLSAAQRATTPNAFARAVGEAIAQIDTEITNLRALITELRPAALDELGVTAALDALCERAHARGVEVEARVDLRCEAGRESERLAPDLETAIYRITQEALTNAQKHGGATSVEVEIAEGETDVSLLVRDNGSGFDARSRSAGFGLLGMRERVELLGGSLDVRSTPGAGTEVRATLPVVRSTPAEPVARLRRLERGLIPVAAAPSRQRRRDRPPAAPGPEPSMRDSWSDPAAEAD
jgi:signal transduction histidine kinase